jgi:hypothetical protein
MRLLVIGGLHGDEPLGKAVVAALEASPEPNVTPVLGNPRACEVDVRFLETDLNRVFPGDILGAEYEVRRAYELRAWFEDDEFDLILDFHNTVTPYNDCGFVGDHGDRAMPAAAAAFLGLPRIVIANYDCINRYAPNCLSIEVSLDSPECRADLWVARVRRLASLEPADLQGLVLPPMFQFTRRITAEEIRALPTEPWRAFMPIPEPDSSALALPPGARAIFVDERCRRGYYAAVIVPARTDRQPDKRSAYVAAS